jgi:hypothetical protein
LRQFIFNRLDGQLKGIGNGTGPFLGGKTDGLIHPLLFMADQLKQEDRNYKGWDKEEYPVKDYEPFLHPLLYPLHGRHAGLRQAKKIPL